MVKLTKKKLVVLIGLVLIGGLLLWIIMGAGGRIPSPAISLNGKKLVCDVEVDADVFTPADIESARCKDTKQRCTVGVTTYSIFDPLGLLEEEVLITLSHAGLRYGGKKVELTKFPGITSRVQFYPCVSQDMYYAKIEAVNKDGGIDDTMEVNF